MTLADEVGTLVHAFGDAGRRDSVRQLARRVDTLESFAASIAEGDCAYGDGCPASTLHRRGRCTSCRARIAVVEASS
jgi:hypothetical protein